MHMNNGSLKPCILTTRRVVPNTGIYKLLEQQTNSANLDTRRGEIMVRVRAGIASRLPESLVRSAQQVEDDDARRLIYRFTVNKMIPKYQSGRNTN